MEKIQFTYAEFTRDFAELRATEDLFNSARSGAPVFITDQQGEIDLDPEIHRRGVMLAVAHIIYTRQNPDSIRQVSSATEGSVSAGFNLYAGAGTNAKYYALSCTPYGMELLIILKTIQPPLPDKPNTSGIYYPARKGFL